MAAIDPAERLLNLVIALTHTRVRMLRSEIRATVQGYDPVDPSMSEEESKKRDAAFERMFERDKDDLRRWGVPIRTVTDAAHGDDIGYKIHSSDAIMPAIDLTPAELAVIGVAAEYWQGAVLGADARQGLVKVASQVTHHASVDLPFAARTTAAQDATAALIEAAHDRQAVRFEYASATSGTTQRTVEPWRLMIRGGTEYLVGRDRDRDAPRTFRIGRIHGAVKKVGSPGSFEPPEVLPDTMLTGPGDPGTALVALRAEAGHALRSRGEFVSSDGDWDLVRVPFHHPDAVRDEVLALAGAARVVEPPELAASVLEHARAALKVTHG
ncbi:MAG: WYL domain-containing protein [Actinobacteria bacterium HGW-Actinobacteria-4]|nr:MAG: WYL domain-containing protein [Actinobacteria bacterium HGW-Actinobacteria-4]